MRTFSEDLEQARRTLPCEPWRDEHWSRIREMILDSQRAMRSVDLSGASLRGAMLR